MRLATRNAFALCVALAALALYASEASAQVSRVGIDYLAVHQYEEMHNVMNIGRTGVWA